MQCSNAHQYRKCFEVSEFGNPRNVCIVSIYTRVSGYAMHAHSLQLASPSSWPAIGHKNVTSLGHVMPKNAFFFWKAQ